MTERPTGPNVVAPRLHLDCSTWWTSRRSGAWVLWKTGLSSGVSQMVSSSMIRGGEVSAMAEDSGGVKRTSVE